MNESNVVFDSIQLIPLGESEISPLMTRVKIKVFHLGMNRNRSYIDKPTALEMAKTLRGCPIAGRYRQEKGDFTDHGEEITINDQGVKVEYLTKPYGFVDLNAKVWFEDYIDIDEFGNQLQHTYLVTEGVVWTEQYPELKESLVFDGARPQSMELDEKTLKGDWSQDYNSGVEFFIISEAVITKLCILGEDVEPCFIGSTVSLEDKEEVLNFSLNKDFGQKLYNMMQELNLALKGEPKMDNEQSIVSEQIEVSTKFEENQDNVVEEIKSENDNTVESNFEAVEESLEAPSVEEEAPATEFVEEAAQEATVEEAPVVEESVSAETQEVEVEFAKEEDKKEESKEEEKEDSKEDTKESDSKEKEEESKEDEKKKYSLLEEEYNTLKTQYSELETKYQELVSFKASIEDKGKDELISSFTMLDDEEKKDIVENKTKFSLDEIESKLSVLFARKQMKAQAAEEVEKTTEEVTEAPLVYTAHSDLSVLPDWVKAVQETQKNM